MVQATMTSKSHGYHTRNIFSKQRHQAQYKRRRQSSIRAKLDALVQSGSKTSGRTAGLRISKSSGTPKDKTPSKKTDAPQSQTNSAKHSETTIDCNDTLNHRKIADIIKLKQ